MPTTDAEVREAYQYFAKNKLSSSGKSDRSDDGPKTKVQAAGAGGRSSAPAEGMEPIGQRIIEVPDDLDPGQLRDWRIGFTDVRAAGKRQRARRWSRPAATAGRCSAHLPRQRPPRYRAVPPIAGVGHLHVPPAVRLQGRRAGTARGRR